MSSEGFKEVEIGLIPEDWGIGTLGKDLKVKGRIGWKGYKRTDLRESGPVVLGGSNIVSNIFLDLSEIKHLKRDKYEESPEIFLKEGDILLVTRGSNISDVGHFDGSINEATINPSLVILSDFVDDPKFLFYYLISPSGKWNILTLSSGSSIPAIYQADVKKLEYPKPSINEQKKISAILYSIDQKININRKMNQTLEKICQAIFKHWFVHFEFPNEEGKPYKSSGGEMVDSELGKIPNGWKIKSLDKIANYLNGLALQKFPPEKDDYLPVIKIRELKQGVTAASDKASTKIDPNYIIDDGDVIFSWSGSLEVVLWCGGKGALNQHLFKVSSEEYPKWFYYYWTKYHLETFRQTAADKTTTMGHIKRKDLSDALVIVPSNELFSKFNKIMAPLIDLIINNNVESRNLSQIRDSILPKLISGKIRVK